MYKKNINSIYFEKKWILFTYSIKILCYEQKKIKIKILIIQKLNIDDNVYILWIDELYIIKKINNKKRYF